MGITMPPKHTGDDDDSTSGATSPWLKFAEETAEREALAKQAKEINERDRSRASEFAVTYYKDALTDQKDFAERTATLNSQGTEMSQAEFEDWEDQYEYKLLNAQEELGNDAYDINKLAELKQEIIFSTEEKEIRKTIEAQAGHYYYDRMSALRNAIMQSEEEESKKEENLDYIKGFYNAVMVHLDYRYMSPEEVRDAENNYDTRRTDAHNNAIKYLNQLNKLARKYGTRPFTVRNFLPSDVVEKKKQTPAISKIMRYDRDTLEEYYAIAFSSEVRERRIRLKREMGYGV